MIFGINTTSDISKLSQIMYNNFEISLVVLINAKYHYYGNHAITFTNVTIHWFVFCRYLNTHLKKQKQDYGEISAYSISVSPDAMEEVMDVGAVS